MKKEFAKKNTLLLLIITALLLISQATLFTYAYFGTTLSTTTSPSFSFDDNSASSVIVTTLDELYIKTQDTYFNNLNKLSNNSDRHTITMLNNLILKSDLIVTADCHINLGGNTLNLNGYNLIVKHSYTGTFVISNGFISSPYESRINELGATVAANSQSRLIIDTPNAVVVVSDDVIGVDGLANAIGSVCYDENYTWKNINTISETTIVNNAFKMIASVLSDNYDDNKLFANTENLNDINYKSASFYSDIDLPYHYYSFDELHISYSSNSNFLSQYGKVTQPQVGTVENVNLTATVSYNDITLSKVFPVKIINQSDYTNWATFGVDTIIDYLQYYAEYDANNTFLYYSIIGSLVLPQSNYYFNASYFYETLDVNQDVMQNSNTNNDHFVPISNSNDDNPLQINYILTLDDSVKFLRITCNASGTSISETVAVQGEGNTSIINNYTYATSIVRQLYGNRIEISPSINPNNSINGYTVQELYRDVAPYEQQGVLSIDYSLINNIDAVYNIGDITQTAYGLFVSSSRNQDPSVTQSVFVNITFTFNTPPYTVSINLPIYYVEDEAGTNINSFQPYYNYYNQQFVNNTNSYTYKNFSVPLTFGSTYPIYYFDIVDEENNVISNQDGQLLINNNVVLSQSISYKRNDITTTYSYAQFLALSSTNMLQMVISGNATWNISINTAYIPLTDTRVNLRYRYKISPDSITWAGEGQIDETTGDLIGVYKSILTIPGIVRNEAGRITDANLYTRLFSIYHPNETYTAGSTFIIFSRLSNIVEEIDFSNNDDAATNKITTFEGLNYLTGLRRLNLQNALSSVISQTTTANKVSATATQIGYISQMKHLEYLNLADNSLMDRASNAYGLPTGNDNGFIENLSNLIYLKELHFENSDSNADNNNAIYQFDDLQEFSALEVVYLYNNRFETVNFQGILSFLNAMFEDLVNGIYGSGGGRNQAIYASLYANGVLVYYDEIDGELISYEPDNSNVYYVNFKNLSNIEYQETLKPGISIEHIYENFSTNPAAYGIATPEDIEGSTNLVFYNHTISFSPVFDNPEDTVYTTNKFAISYTITYNYTYGILGTSNGSVDIPITLEFEIIRK